MFDIIISGGTVVDGTGAPPYRKDLGITGERIEAIDDLTHAEARHVINASGLCVSPGFIDTHVHSDAVLLLDPQHAQGLRQGITTEILGQDGLSYAPLSPESYKVLRRYLAGILGVPPLELDMSSVASFRSHYHKKTAINTAYLVPHAAVRLETIGFRDAPLTGDTLKGAQRLIREGIEQGAVGFATGMSYYPNAWSDTAELIELCKATQEAGGVYVTHVRDRNIERGFGGGGVAEALEIGRRSGVGVHLSHHRTDEATAGRVADVMSLIDAAKVEGVDCTFDIYPYPTGSSYPMSLLATYAHEGGPDALIKRLRDPAQRRELAQQLDDNSPRPLGGAVLSYLFRNSHLEGMSLSDIAKDRGVSMGEALCDLLLDEDLQVSYWLSPPDSVAVWRQISRDSLELLSRPDSMVGSDSIHVGSVPHPRAYGTFPRYLGRLRRQFGVLTMEQMVQRMTDNPARRFALTYRGRIEKGYFADIVVFDPESIIDCSTYDDPCQFPIGIPYVVVNGQVAVDRQRCTGVLAGQAVP